MPGHTAYGDRHTGAIYATKRFKRKSHPYSSSAVCQCHMSSLPSEPKLTTTSASSPMLCNESSALLLCQLTAVTGSLHKTIPALSGYADQDEASHVPRCTSLLLVSALLMHCACTAGSRCCLIRGGLCSRGTLIPARW